MEFQWTGMTKMTKNEKKIYLFLSLFLNFITIQLKKKKKYDAIQHNKTFIKKINKK